MTQLVEVKVLTKSGATTEQRSSEDIAVHCTHRKNGACGDVRQVNRFGKPCTEASTYNGVLICLAVIDERTPRT